MPSALAMDDLPRFTGWQCTCPVKLRKLCRITFVFGENVCCDCRWSRLGELVPGIPTHCTSSCSRSVCLTKYNLKCVEVHEKQLSLWCGSSRAFFGLSMVVLLNSGPTHLSFCASTFFSFSPLLTAT